MENLTLDENNAGAGGQQQQQHAQQPQPTLGPSPQNQQLPPQMFTTAAQLLDMTDSKEFSFYIFLAWIIGYPIPDFLFYLFTASNCDWGMLLTQSTEKLMVALRDGRKLIGVLRSWDQFGTLPHPTCNTHSLSRNQMLTHYSQQISSSNQQSSASSSPPPQTSSSSPLANSESSKPGLYADVPRGIFLVRGENVLLLGEIDLDKDDDPPPGYEKAEVELVHKLNTERKAKEARREKSRNARLRALGFEGENTAEASL